MIETIYDIIFIIFKIVFVPILFFFFYTLFAILFLSDKLIQLVDDAIDSILK